ELRLGVEPVEEVLPVAGRRRRRVDAEGRALDRGERQLLQEFAILPRQGLGRPLGGDARIDIEPRRLGAPAGRRVVIPEQDDVAPLANQIEAFVGTRAVSDDVAQTDDALGPPRVDFAEDRLERLQVSVDVRDEDRGHPREGRASWAIRSRIPFTNDPDVSIPYFFAISIVSSRATRVGVSA